MGDGVEEVDPGDALDAALKLRERHVMKPQGRVPLTQGQLVQRPGEEWPAQRGNQQIAVRWFEPERWRRRIAEDRRSRAGKRGERANAETEEERPRPLGQVGYTDGAVRGRERIRERRIVALD